MIRKISSILILLTLLIVLFPIGLNSSDAATVKSINILFIGNSKMYFNNMPAMYSNMLNKSGKKHNYKVLVKGSMSLNFHYHYIKEHPDQIKDLFKDEKIDYLVLNEQTDVQLAPYGTLYDSKYDPNPEKQYTNKRVYGNLSLDALRIIKKLNSYGMINKKSTKIILNATWNYSDLEDINITNNNFAQARNTIKEAGYVNCEIAYSGTILKKVDKEMRKKNGSLTRQQLFLDERHTTQLGSYIEALALYKAMFNTNMVANYAGSVSVDKMQQSIEKYAIIDNYKYRNLYYSNIKDLQKRAFDLPKLNKINEYQEIIAFVNNSL